jgi:hypothetical protein
VDPDASGDAQPAAGLAVLGAINLGSGGGVPTSPAQADRVPRGVCAPLAAADPLVAAGGAKVVLASSRS